MQAGSTVIQQTWNYANVEPHVYMSVCENVLHMIHVHSHGKDLDGVPLDDEFPILDLYVTVKPTVGGVILEQVGLETAKTHEND